ncbi:DMT family transporter [Actinoplanes sp. NPDC024001]|uniref:DMT family transporter n=1 Tax=Actinoplanes sp. NPDC024001 TaxID=3154598 RepID=UPI0033E734CB
MGPVLCLISAAAFGAMAVFGKFAYQEGVSTPALLLVRFGLAAALLAALHLARPGRRWRAGPRVLVTALAMGAVGYATQAGLYFAALRIMDAPLLSLILYTFPVLVTVTAVLLGRDRLTPGRVIALLVASCGTLLVLLGTGGVAFEPLGAVLAFGSAVTYTVYILVADTVVQRIPPVPLAALVMAGAFLTFAGYALLTGTVALTFGWRGWFWLLCIAAVSTVLAQVTFFAGLRRTGPSAAAILSTFEPVVTTALAALTLHEVLTPIQLAGALLVLASAAALQLRRRDPLPTAAGRPPRATSQSAAHPTSPHPAPPADRV